MSTDCNPVVTAAPPAATVGPQGLRVWPAILIAAIQIACIVYWLTPQFANLGRFLTMLIGPAVCLLLFLIWWLGFSRATWREKWLLIGMTILSVAAVAFASHPTVSFNLWSCGVPLWIGLVTVAAWLVERQAPARRLAILLPAIVLAWIPFTLFRVNGVDGSFFVEASWRWLPTHEQQLTAAEVTPVPTVATVNSVTVHDWPGFRGPTQDSRVEPTALVVGTTGGSAAAPASLEFRELWRVPVGPGWGSFAIVGDSCWTQEQRGEQELTICRKLRTGEEVWRNETPSRFEEVVSGAGPRATPTVTGSQVYVFGGRGVLKCLSAADGTTVWEHDLVSEYQAPVPMWGFSSSPVVQAGIVSVFADGAAGHGLLGFDALTGELRWKFDESGMSYSSCQPMTLAGVSCLVFAGTKGLVAISPETGTLLWRFADKLLEAAPLIQPQQISSSDIIVARGDGIGLARVRVAKDEQGWSVVPIWSERTLKPSFNDFVVHENSIYGFDQEIFTCISAETGQRQWKKGRYGFGQVLLINTPPTLLVQSERGELVLVNPTPDDLVEQARVAALTDKTWNHPAIGQGCLLVRNSVEAVGFEIVTPASGTAPASATLSTPAGSAALN